MAIRIKPRPRVIIERALQSTPDARPAELARQLGLNVEVVRGLIHLARKGYKAEGPLDRR